MENTTASARLDATVTALSNAVMRGFAATLNYKIADLDLAIAVMRAETTALLFDERYEAARQSVIGRSLHQATVVNLVVAEAVAAYLAKGGK